VAAWLLALALARRRRARPAARPRPPASPGQARAAFSTGVLAVDEPAKERAVVRMSSGLVVALLASLWLPGSMAGQDPQAPRARSAQRASGVELVGERSTPNPRMPIGPVGPAADLAPSHTIVTPPPALPALPPGVEAIVSTVRLGAIAVPGVLLDAY
jgi:hypothetical protein